jgi:exopolysaccharide biosynthesis predicted pyruvyltransferase EpsI
VPEYSFATEALERFSRSAGRVIVLPQTIRGIAALIGSLGGNVELFARDHASYRFCREAATAASVALDHDMAFFADMDALLRRRGLRGFAPRPSNFVRLALLAALRVRARFTPTLRAFRVDRESGTPGRGSLATDVSKLCAFGTATVERNLFAAAQFVQAIDRFRAVHTDRLHVAIAAARLGKSTVVHETAQQKCGPVYEMSLKRLGVELAA